MIDLDKAREFVTELERDPDRVQAYYGELQTLISECMEEVHELAKQGETDRKMKLVAVEYRARLILQRWKRSSTN